MRLRTDDSWGLYGSRADPETQREAFVAGEVPVAVYGLGKMGLPLAAVYADTTGNVIGADIDPGTVARINRGECPVVNEPELPALVSTAVAEGALRATDDPRAAADAASVHVIIVPTTVREDATPDLAALRAVTRDVGDGLDRGDVVIVESTVPPGTCREVVLPLLESASGLSLGEFGLAFCPERTLSGRAVRDVRGGHPKVVGGADAESTRVAALVYGELSTNEIIPTSDVTTAECVKVFEGVYRDVNIALANELARLTDELGVDVIEAIDVANTQPYCDIHAPGAGVGGHCIPYYPHFLIHGYATDTPLLRTARAVNESMPAFAADAVFDGLADVGTDPAEATVLVLGLTYRPGVRETRESPALPLIRRLGERGATVYCADPLVDDFEPYAVRGVGIDRVADLDLDAIVLVTAHDAFDAIDWEALGELVVVDGRDALDLDGTDHRVYTIGRG